VVYFQPGSLRAWV